VQKGGGLSWYSRKAKKAETKSAKWQRQSGDDDHDSCEEPTLALNRISDSLR